jgi:C1A family cysteine protease
MVSPPRRYGWKRDLPDHRDLSYSAPRELLSALPPHVDLRDRFPVPCYDQGALGSCTGNAIAAAVQFARMKELATPYFAPSRLFIYLNERLLEGTRLYDAGAQIRDGIKSVAKHGICPEVSSPPSPADWPYDVERFVEQPPDASYVFARAHRAIEYRRVAIRLADMRACLAGGFPFVFGFSVFESFETAEVARTGIVPLPGASEACLGGHAVLAVGYDDASHRLVVRNSWGTSWGNSGHFVLPYAYLLDGLGDDLWTVRRVEK